MADCSVTMMDICSMQLTVSHITIVNDVLKIF